MRYVCTGHYSLDYFQGRTSIVGMCKVNEDARSLVTDLAPNTIFGPVLSFAGEATANVCRMNLQRNVFV